MIITYGVRFRCDLCDTVADSPGPLINSGEQLLSDAGLPEGWTSGALTSLTLRDMWGTTIEHLCGACQRLDLGQVVTRLRERTEQRKAAI